MSRHILDSAMIHPAIQESIATKNLDIVLEVQQAIAKNKIVVVGMAQNPAPKRTRKTLDALGAAHAYLEYGSYFSLWYKRNALKMWTGWPSFPMIFVDGVLIGGNSDLNALVESGEFAKMLGKS